MKLGFYLPNNATNAPARVADKILSSLVEDVDFSIDVIEGRDDVVREPGDWDLVHFPVSPFIAPTFGFFFYLQCLRRGIPLLTNYHGDFRNELLFSVKNRRYGTTLKYLPSALLGPSLLARSDCVIVNSSTMETKVRENYGVNSVCCIPNGPLLSGHPNGERLDRDYILYHGRLSFEKGVDLLIDGYSQSVIKGKLDLVLCGDGPYRSRIENQVESLGIEDHVELRGELSHDDLYSLVRDARICVYPSRFDGFSISALESLIESRGAVILSDDAGLSDHIQEDIEGLFVFSRHLDSLEKKLEEAYLTRLTDRKVLERQKRFRNVYSWSNIADQYRNIYLDLTGSQ